MVMWTCLLWYEKKTTAPLFKHISMSTLFIKALALDAELKACSAINAASYHDKIIRAYEQKSLDELLLCFASDNVLDKNALRVFLENNRVRTHLTSIRARANSALTQLLLLAANELEDKVITIQPSDLSDIAYDYDIDGQDYSRALVNWLGANIALETDTDLALFVCLSEKDMRLMLTENTHIAASFVTLHATMSTVVTLLNSTVNLGASQYLLDYLFIENPRLFSLEQMSCSFALLDNNKIMFFAQWCIEKTLVNPLILTEEKNASYTLLLKSAQKQLPGLVSNAQQLIDVLRWLPLEHREIVLQLIHNRLPGLITEFDELYTLFLLLPEGLYESVVDLMRDSLPNYITHYEQLTDIFTFLSEKSCGLVIEAVQSSLPRLINNLEQLRGTILWLPKEPRGLVVASMQARLPDFITCFEQLVAVLKLLAEEQCVSVIESIRNRLPDWITDHGRLMDVFKLLTDEYSFQLIESIQDRLPQLIKDIEQLKACVLWFPKEHRIKIITLMRDILLGLITEMEQLKDCFLWLSQESWIEVVGAMQSHFSDWIVTTEDFVDFLEYCPKESRGLVIESVRDRLPMLITNAVCLLHVLRECPEESRELVIESIQSTLPAFALNLGQLMLVLNSLRESQRPKIILTMAKIPAFLDNILTKARALEYRSYESYLINTLQQLGKKSLDLARNGATTKAYTALSLYDEINKRLTHYQQSQRTNSDYNKLYNQCVALISNEKNNELQCHRGWKELFINLMIGIASLGLAFAVNKIITGGRCTFFNINTDSLNKVDALANALEALAPTPS